MAALTKVSLKTPTLTTPIWWRATMKFNLSPKPGCSGSACAIHCRTVLFSMIVRLVLGMFGARVGIAIGSLKDDRLPVSIASS